MVEHFPTLVVRSFDQFSHHETARLMSNLLLSDLDLEDLDTSDEGEATRSGLRPMGTAADSAAARICRGDCGGAIAELVGVCALVF